MGPCPCRRRAPPPARRGLEWLRDPGTLAAAARIRHAVGAVLADSSLRTPELGGRLTTREMTDAILERI